MIRKMMNKLNYPRQALSKDDGFSLVELMVVIVIIGLLTTIVVINVLPSNDKAFVTKAKVDVKTLEQAVEAFYVETLRYPTMEEGLDALLRAPGGNSFRTEGFIKSLPKDPWGSDYQFLIPGEHGKFDIFSLGADKALGGEGLNADIGNWIEKED